MNKIEEIACNLAPDTPATDGNMEIFKSDADGYFYTRNTETGRCTRYNAEMQNGKRISAEAWDEAWVEVQTRKAEEDQTTEEVKAETREHTKRKSKLTAFESKVVNGVTLTEKQVDFLHHLPDMDFWENGLESCLWVDILNDQIGGQFTGKPMTVGAMVSTLNEKGLLMIGNDRRNGKRVRFIELSDNGKLVAQELGLH